MYYYHNTALYAEPAEARHVFYVDYEEEEPELSPKIQTNEDYQFIKSIRKE